MYYPKNTKELFLVDDGNNFPVEALKEYEEYLRSREEYQGQPARLYRDVAGKVCISYNTAKAPLNDFPISGRFNEILKDAAIIIYEPPEENPPAYLYIAGADPYNQSSSIWSKSLGSMFIYKRIFDPISGSFQRRIVAEYTARPETMKEFHENCEMLLEAYNAVCMPENEAQTFIQYFDLKNKIYLLAEGYSFLKEISPSTSIKGRNIGLPATRPVQRLYKEAIFNYLTEVITVGYDEEHQPITKLGLTRIPSLGLIRELIHYNDTDNFDRYVAFGHTLLHETWADKMYPIYESKPVEQSTPTNSIKIDIKSPFSIRSSGYKSNGLSNPFGI